jgi:ADP-heptose:LPS heptosyltransferase
MTARTSQESGATKARSLRVALFHTAFIGDLALAGTLIEGLHAAGHTIALVSNAAGSALYAHDKRLSERVVVKKGKGLRKLRALFECARALKALELDVLLVPHRSLTSSLIAKLSGVRRTIGFASATGACLYKETKPYLLECHESERLLSLAPDDLVPSALRGGLRLRGNLQAEGRPHAFFEAFPHLERENIGFFVVSPGSVWKTKQYPAAAFAQACRLLLERHSRLECVLAGGPSDTEARNAFLNAASLWNKDLQKRLHDATHSSRRPSSCARACDLEPCQ